MKAYRIAVRAKAGARKASLTRLPDAAQGQAAFAVAVTEPALEGRANRAIERALAQHLGLPASRVVLGEKSRDKVAEIAAQERSGSGGSKR
ncbi:MAG: DUF167 domain-containing protein [Terriglobales bacterium]